jgi:hypothetical protein
MSSHRAGGFRGGLPTVSSSSSRPPMVQYRPAAAKLNAKTAAA